MRFNFQPSSWKYYYSDYHYHHQVKYLVRNFFKKEFLSHHLLKLPWYYLYFWILYFYEKLISEMQLWSCQKHHSCIRNFWKKATYLIFQKCWSVPKITSSTNHMMGVSSTILWTLRDVWFLYLMYDVVCLLHILVCAQNDKKFLLKK